MGEVKTPAQRAHMSSAATARWAEGRRERILSKVDRSGGPLACWPWVGSRDVKDYGSVKINGCTKKAHRVVYELLTGRTLPDALLLRHRCSTFGTSDAPMVDSHSCCNPAHLLEGTLLQNNRDEIGKLHRRRGTKPPRAKPSPEHRTLSDDDIREIRAAHGRGTRLVDLAYDYKLTVQQIFRITRRTSWGHVPDAPPTVEGVAPKGVPVSKAHMSADTRLTLLAYYASGKTQIEVAERFQTTQANVSRIVRAAGTQRPTAKLTEDDVRSIRDRKAAGESQSALGAEYRVTPRTIAQIATRETWGHVS